MDTLDKFLQANSLHDPDDIDSLIELASITRELIDSRQYDCLESIINYTLQHRYHEAFCWCIGILQETLEKEDCSLDSFECVLGQSIPDYDEFIARLQVDLNACINGTETVYDSTGEATSFFNILVYNTGYRNIRLVSSENFDTKDNDFVQYRLSFFRD